MNKNVRIEEQGKNPTGQKGSREVVDERRRISGSLYPLVAYPAAQ